MATGTQKLTIQPAAGKTGDTYQVTTPRDTDVYPLTQAGLQAFLNAVAAGNHSGLTPLDGSAVIAAGTKPTNRTATVSVGSGELSYSYDGTELTIEGASNLKKLKFERQDGGSATVTNRDAAQVIFGNFYDHGDLAGVTGRPYQWRINYASCPPLKLTTLDNDGSTTKTYLLTPVSGALHVALSPSSSGSTGTGSTTTNPPATGSTPSTTPTSGSATSYNKPPFDTFDYAPITTNANAWNSSDSYNWAGGPIGEVLTFTNQDGLEMRLGKRMGGTLYHLSYQGGENQVNNASDMGRGWAGSFFLGGYTRDDRKSSANDVYPGWANWQGTYAFTDGDPNTNKGTGHNPIPVGDYFNNSSPVLFMGYRIDADGVRMYVKSQLMNWPANNDLTDIIYEQWYFLPNRGQALEFRFQINHNRTTDKIQYPPYEPDEYPCQYLSYRLHYLAYIGNDGNVTYNEADDLQPQMTGGNWVMGVTSANENNVGAGQWSPYLSNTNRKLQGGGEGQYPAFSGSSLQIENTRKFIHDWNTVQRGVTHFFIGTVAQMKSYAATQASTPIALGYNAWGWKYNAQWGRWSTTYEAAGDEGFPVNNEGIKVITTVQSGDWKIRFPDIVHTAADAQKFVMRYRTSTDFPAGMNFQWSKAQQTEYISDADHTGGAAGGQVVSFNIITDGQWHVVEVPVSQHAKWNGIINQRTLSAQSNPPVNSWIQIDWINSVNQDPSTN